MRKDTTIYRACSDFLVEWNRDAWVAEHGKWTSEEWDERRENYDDAVVTLQEKAEGMPFAMHLDKDFDLAELYTALNAVRDAVYALHDQVVPDESDYIAEGRIDPDNVADIAIDLDIGKRQQEWDCIEVWCAYRHIDALYLRWLRLPYPNTLRHHRDLWICIDPDYFKGEDEA